jgi:hypothetical protein
LAKDICTSDVIGWTFQSYSEISIGFALVMNLNPIGVAAFKAAVIAHAFYLFLKLFLDYMGNP